MPTIFVKSQEDVITVGIDREIERKIYVQLYFKNFRLEINNTNGLYKEKNIPATASVLFVYG